jgi:divalent metal cation (Fe/Co/Zn/Cd) transporter
LDEDAEEAHQATESNATQVRIAIQASFIVNCLLAALQLYAAISSLSLSFFATALDAVFDPCANFALNYACVYIYLSKKKKKKNMHVCLKGT